MTNVMRALRWHGNHDVRLDTVDVPQPGPTEVLIEVIRVGLCGTDLEEYRDGPLDIPVGSPHPTAHQSAPITLGHEVVGVVHSSPPGRPAVGSFVVPDVVIGCGSCWWCQRHQPGQCRFLAVRGFHADGGLAPFMLADAQSCVMLPADMSPDVAVFAESTAVAVRGFRKAGDVTGAVLCIQGAGTVGTLLAQISLASPASVVLVVDPDMTRRSRLNDLGAHTASVEDALDAVMDLTDGRGADVVFECSGVADGPQQAALLSRRGGGIVLVGFGPPKLQLDWLPFVLGERRLLGSAAHVWDEDVSAAVSLLHRKIVNPATIEAEVIPLSRVVEDGFQRLERDRRTPKLIVDPRDGVL